MCRPLLTLFALLSIVLAPTAQAYLDPASGSMVLQMILGGIAGLAVIIKLYWGKLLGLFGVKKSEHDEPTS